MSMKKARGDESRLHQAVGGTQLTRHQKAKIAEAAVLLRLVLHRMTPYGSWFDGDKADWLVQTESGKIVTVQVKWAGQTNSSGFGLPSVRLKCTTGHGRQRRYEAGEFDFIVGYDLFTDTCYVWSWDEVSHLKAAVTITPEAAERWDKMRA